MKCLVCFLVLAASLPAQLPPAEAAGGWIQLFDGATSFGWTAEGEARWQVDNGVLSVPDGQVGWIRTNSPFADFILKLEFRTKAGGNSGVFIRSAASGAPHETGYEVQIWDNNPKFPTGSLVNHVPASRKAGLKANHWHAYEIRAEGSRFSIKLDGRELLNASDPKSRAGYIGLQANKDKIEFRNIKLKPLGMKPLFNGKDLSGWKVVEPPKPPKAPAKWSVKNGMINVIQGGGQLETEGSYADFVLQMDIRTNPKDSSHHPNSGVFFRGDPGAYWSGYESQIRNEFKGDRTVPVDWGTGAIYNLVATRRVVAGDGQFFTKTIVANGRRLAVWINGYPVTDWEDTRPEGKNARRNARLEAGTVSLQAHDPTTNLDFRNVHIAELPRP